MLQQSLKVQIKKKTSFIRIAGGGIMPVMSVYREKLIKFSNILTMPFSINTYGNGDKIP
jgi:hypothetical protein